MEMPGPWKAWKSKSSFSPLFTAPWESRQRREIPTFPQPSGNEVRGGKGYGNAGSMESVEKQKQLFPSFHSPLGISPKARDSHIPTAWHCPGWESGKPKPGFPLFHAGHATTTAVCLFSEPKTKKGDRPLRGLLNHVFQDHARLETELSFRIILRLENAPSPGRSCNSVTLDFHGPL